MLFLLPFLNLFLSLYVSIYMSLSFYLSVLHSSPLSLSFCLGLCLPLFTFPSTFLSRTANCIPKAAQTNLSVTPCTRNVTCRAQLSSLLGLGFGYSSLRELVYGEKVRVHIGV